MSTQIQWLAPPPLWQELSSASDTTQFRSPAILRFATDTFMQDLQNVLQNTPQTLRNYVAQGENWRNPGAGLGYVGPTPALPLKLYQPTHQRFYLVASSLTCRMPGLPDHTVNKAAGESVVFVVRQLRPNAGYTVADCAVDNPVTCTEFAWIPAGAGATTASSTAAATSSSTTASTQNASNNQAGWMQASGPNLVAGEEQIPLSLTQTGSNGSSRRIFIGLIPASRRQQYVGGTTLPANGASSGGSASSTANSAPTDPRIDLFHRQIVGPWWNLEDWWNHLDAAPAGSTLANENTLSTQLSSALILYDFSTFLGQYIPNVWAAIENNSKVSALSSAEAALYNTLSAGLRQALINANTYGPQFESIGPANQLPSGYTAYALTDAANLIKPHTLQAPVSNALPPLSSVNVPALPPLPQKPSVNTQGDYWFIVRCVYLRPQCQNNIVSPPCQPFQLANYFDSDAPARRIQVALPVDTSPAALRKYDKGVAFMLSKELRNQMARATSLTDLANGQLGDPGGLTVGWICSFSIPIITICAMILLLIIVIALNLVFFWIPFFKICFPVPELEGN